MTNKRYIWLAYAGAGNTYSEFYSFNCSTNTLAFEYTLPQHIYTPLLGGNFFSGPACTVPAKAHGGGLCWSAGHTAVAMVGGQAYFVPVYQTQSPFADQVAYMRINAGANLLNVPVEAGGGLTIGPKLSSGNNDFHIGCSDAGACVLSSDQDPPIQRNSSTQYSDALTGCTNTTPITCSYLTAELSSYIANTQSIVIGGIQGACARGINGIAWRVANLNTRAQTFQLADSTAQGTCTRNTGGIVRNAHPSQTSNQTGVWLIDARQIASKTFTITRLPNSRSFAMHGSLSPPSSGPQYYQQAHCVLSRDATLVGCNSGSLPDTIQTIIIPTGFRNEH